MQPEIRRYLDGILDAANLLNTFNSDKTFADYANDPLLRSATERQFGIIGEAISKPAKINEPTAARITDYRRIISFRNILIHDYDAVDNLVVWEILKHKLPILILEVDTLLQE